MRVIKAHEERKNEILNVAEKLFTTKGYEKTTVNDILREIGIAKGTFYYYFKSKEEVLDAIVSGYKEIIATRAEAVLNKKGISPEEKLMNAFMSMRIIDKVDSNMLDEIHKAQNAILHQKILNQLVTTMAPILEKIIKEGIEKKVWNCRYPLQYMQIFLASSLTLTDEGIFELDGDSQMKVMAALISLLEKILDVPEDSFMQMYMENMS